MECLTTSHKKEEKLQKKKILVITCYVMLYTDIDFNEWSGVLGRKKEYPELVSFSHRLCGMNLEKVLYFR